MTVRHSLLLPLAAIAAWGSAWIATGWRDPTPMTIVLWCAAAAVIIAALRTSGGIRSALAIGAACAAIGAAVAMVSGFGHGLRQPDSLTEHAGGGRSLTVSIEVTSVGDDRFRGTVRAWESAEVRHTAAAPVSVFAVAPAGVGIGSLVEVQGRLQRTEPGDRVGYRVFPTRVTVVGAPPPLLGAMSALRQGFIDQVRTMPGEGAGLLPGLAIGDTRAVSSELDAAMKTVSLTHLTAVSGANCAIVTGLVLLVTAWLRFPRWSRTIAALVALAGFVLLVTPEPSVLRAAVMAVVVLTSAASGRPNRGVSVLAVSIVVLLCHDPWLAREFGFVLSVLATGGLLLLSAPLASAMSRVMPRPLAVIVALPLAAQLACQPAIVLLDAALPTHGVVANLLAAPAAPVATVLGALACVLLPVLPGLSVPLAWVAWAPAAWIAAVAELTAALPFARVPWPEGLLGMLALAVLTALALVALLNPRRRRESLLVFATAAALLIGATTGGELLTRLGRPSGWQLAQCDVGQGDAVFLRSEGAIGLIDTGPSPDALAGCLDTLGIDRIDLLVLTHFDHDHAGGTQAVLGRVDTALVGPTGRASDEAVVASLRASGVDVVDATTGTWGVLGAHRWRVLWPAAGTRQAGNAASVTLALDPWDGCEPRCLSALLLGDLGAREQDRLVASGAVGAVDVVKVSHHGSADQSAELYRRAAATVALIGVGAENGYGHPTDEVLAILGETAGSVARSDRDGLVLLEPDAAGVAVWRQRVGAGE